MIDKLVLADAPEAQLIAAADRVRSFTEWLAALPVRHWYEGFAEAANAGNPNALFDQSPLIGLPIRSRHRFGSRSWNMGRAVEPVGRTRRSPRSTVT